MRGVYWTLSLVLIATACLAQTQQPNQPATRGTAIVGTGQKTVVGCVAQGTSGMVLKTDDGRTLPLRGATDLMPYMGKKVQIQASWTSRGVHVAAPLENPDAPAAPAAGAQPSQQFAGDLHVEFQGKVIGDCLGDNK